MRKQLKRIIKLTGKSKSTLKTFIVPTTAGFFAIALTAYCLVAGMVYANNLVLILGILLLITTAFCSITTNFFLHDIHFKNFYFKETHANQRVYCEFECQADIQYENIKVKIFLKDQELLFHFKERNGEKVIYQADSFLPRGQYQFDFVQYSTNYPFGLFYSWKTFRMDGTTLYSYPSIYNIQKISLMKPLKQDPTEIKKGAEEFQNFLKGEKILAGRIDWKRFFSKNEIWYKQYHQFDDDLYFIDLKTISTREREQQISQIASEMKTLKSMGLLWELKSSQSNIIDHVGFDLYKESMRELARYV